MAFEREWSQWTLKCDRGQSPQCLEELMTEEKEIEEAERAAINEGWTFDRSAQEWRCPKCQEEEEE